MIFLIILCEWRMKFFFLLSRKPLWMLFILSILFSSHTLLGQVDSLSPLEQEIENRIKAASKLDDSKEGIKELEAILLSINQQFGEPHRLQGRCFYVMGQFYSDLEDVENTFLFLDKSAQVFTKVEAWKDLGDSYLIIAGNHYYQGDYQRMANILTRANEVLVDKIEPKDDFWGFFYNYYGLANYYIDNYELAIEVGQKELKYSQSIADTIGVVYAYNSLANLYNTKGDYEHAVEHYQYALQLSSTLPEEDQDLKILSKVYANLGLCWNQLKDYEKARFYGEKQLSLLNSGKINTTVNDYIACYLKLALPYIDTENFDVALTWLKRAEQIHLSEEITLNKEQTLHNIGYVYLQQGNYGEAKSYISQAIAIYEEKFPPYYSDNGRAFRHLGEVELAQKNYHQALEFFQKALRILMDPHLPSDPLSHPSIRNFSSPTAILKIIRSKANCLAFMSKEVAEPNKYLRASLETFELNATVIDSMRQVYQTNSKTFWNKEVKPIYEEAIAVAARLYELDQNPIYLEKAFAFAERSKATMLAEAIQESAAQSFAGIPEEFQKKEKQLNIDIGFYEKQIFKAEQKGKEADSTKIRQWQAIIFQKKQEYKAFLANLESQYPKYFQLKYKEQFTDLKTIQASLKQGQAIIEYFYGENSIYVFSIDPINVKLNKIAISPSFVVLVDSFTQQVSNRDLIAEKGLSKELFHQFANQSHRLYLNLVEPIHLSKVDQLLIIPDGVLGFVPFELLIREPIKPEKSVDYSTLDYLVKYVAIRYEYSAHLVHQSTPTQKAARQFLGFAPIYKKDPSLSGSRDAEIDCEVDTYASFASLANNEKEVNSIVQLLDGKGFTGSNATEESFKSQADQYGVLHFAMHAFVNHCDPLYSGLAFTRQGAEEGFKPDIEKAEVENDNLLYAYEIYNMKLNANLVSLSACNTGIGQIAKGEGIMSLARAFKHAGCPNILMSLWQADDQATASIMLSFYENLQNNMPKDDALRQAKLRYINQSKRNHPFYWGTFVLIGDELPLGVPNSPNKKIWLGLGFIVFLMGIYVFRKHIS